MISWKLEKENLIKFLIDEKLSFEEVGRKYKCSGSNIRKVAQRLNIIVPPRRAVNPCETFRRGTAKKVSVRTVEKNLYYIYLIAEFIVVVNVNKSINLRKDMN